MKLGQLKPAAQCLQPFINDREGLHCLRRKPSSIGAQGEIIVDGHVVARVRRGEARKALDLMAPEAEQVVLRLMFADARHPEFELALWDATLPVQTGSPGEALRLGRRWLSHLEALLKG